MESKKSVSLTEAFELLADSLICEKVGAKILTSDDRKYFSEHPTEFCEKVLGSSLWGIQSAIIESLVANDRVTARSSHAIGKSFIGSEIVLWFLNCHVPSTVVTTAPTARQVRDILWREINAQYNGSKYSLGGRILTQQLIMNREKWFAIGYTTEEHDTDKFQGFHNENILVLIDEACGVGDNIYEAVEGLLSSGRKTKLVLIGNPTNEATRFGDSFKSVLYKPFHISAFDTPNFTQFGITLEDIEKNTWQEKITGDLPRPYLVSPKWVNDRYIEWGKNNPLFQVRVLGIFPTESIDTLIPLYWVERANALNFEPSGKKILALDVARTGEDEIVATIRQGSVVHPQIIWFHKDTMETVGRTVSLIKEHKPEMVNIDGIGVGGGVVDRLREIQAGGTIGSIAINDVNVGMTANQSDRFLNIRAEIYWKLREALEKSLVQLPMDSVLASELCTFKYMYTSKGQLKLEPKEDTKERLGKSPDRSDSLALTFYDAVPMAVAGDLSSLYTAKPMPTQGLVESKMKSTSGAIYEKFGLDYNILSKCPECGESVGMTFYNDSGNAFPKDAKYARCIICNKRWELKR
jgi:hypothetical protein